MRTLTRHLAVVTSAALLLVGCSEDPTVDMPPEGVSAPLDEDRADDDAGDGGTSDDADGDATTATPSVPPLLGGPDGIDGWPETEIEFADGALTIVAKVAADAQRRQQGLMHVPELPDEAGMLFVFEDLRSGGFWMKNTLVPLDIAYVADGEIVAILQMEPCEADPCPAYDSGESYDAAIEVRQGLFAEAGVTEGDTVTWTDPVEVDAAA